MSRRLLRYLEIRCLLIRWLRVGFAPDGFTCASNGFRKISEFCYLVRFGQEIDSQDDRWLGLHQRRSSLPPLPFMFDTWRERPRREAVEAYVQAEKRRAWICDFHSRAEGRPWYYDAADRRNWNEIATTKGDPYDYPVFMLTTAGAELDINTIVRMVARGSACRWNMLQFGTRIGNKIGS